MANKYAEDIRQIVGVDGTKGGINAPEPKKSIDGGRGIAWFNSDGTIGSGSGSSGGSDSPTVQPADADDGTGNASGSTGGGGGGSTGDSGITQDDATTPDSVDATALFNNLAIGASTPSEITGLFDCTTSQEYIIRADGEFTAPDGWDDADTPPTIQGYESGVYWTASHTGLTPYYTQAEAAQVGADRAEELNPVIYTNTICDIVQISGTTYAVWVLNTGSTCVVSGQLITKVFCADEYDSICEITPYETEWPASMPAQLTYDQDSASWLTNQYDANIPLEYSGASASQIDLCDTNGDQIQIQPSTNGGLVYTNATDNIFWVRGPDGKITAAGSGSARDMYVAQ